MSIMKANSKLIIGTQVRPSQKLLTNKNGQTLIEFVFLMASIVIISFTLLRGFNGGISTMWKNYVTAIAQPTDSTIEY